MNPQKLNHLNKEFYETCARYWNNAADYEWRGWAKLPLEGLSTPLRVCDLGCGSGRFAHFLTREVGPEVEYLGMDFADFYVDHARTHKPNIIRSYKIIQQDLFTQRWEFNGEVDLVVAFGLIHHLPPAFGPHFFTELRRRFTARTLGIITTWQYLDNPRLAKKILSEHPLQVGGPDNILAWTRGEYGERYSHFWTKQEVVRECARYGFAATYLPEPSAAENGLNNYFLLRLSS